VPTRDPANQPMAFSLLANREVSTWSEEWKHECEIAYLLGMTPEKRRAMLDGVQGAEGDEAKGIKQHRGEAATAQLASEVGRLKELRQRG
jgi:hypothetical protein